MKRRKVIRIVLGLLVLCMFIYFFCIHIKIREHVNMKVSENVDYIIILGARVKGTEPSLSLQYRIDAAADYLKRNTNTVAIASGGMGQGEDISEAEAIKRGLISQGIDKSRIILEDQSTDTVENLTFSKKMLPNNMKHGLVVSNDFHIFRSKMIAKDQGLKLSGLPAKTPSVAIPKSYTREYLAVTKYFLKKYLLK
jgi:uncharacterized SAM-binding protein YcdF (DUF218 family)